MKQSSPCQEEAKIEAQYEDGIGNVLPCNTVYYYSYFQLLTLCRVSLFTFFKDTNICYVVIL
jgi:hypothetical protein